MAFRKSAAAVKRAVGPVVQSLEQRTLFHSALLLNVNFQPANSPVPDGYVADSGASFGDRGNGFSYGWDGANTGGLRDRNKLADQRYDTLNHTQAYGSHKWELAVPNGQYTVHVVAGDPGYTDSVYKFNVEGVLTLSGTPTSSNHFVEGTQTVTVSDGRLTISNASGASNNKLAFVQIAEVDNDAPATVTVSVPDAGAAEGGTNTGSVVFTRSGADLTEPLDIVYSLGGTATNGVDYQQLLGTVTIPAGSASATVTIKPIDDSAAEANETVTVTAVAGAGYVLGATATGTVTIADNDAGFSAHVNFQPSRAAVPGGYVADGGLAYGSRGNGLTYGWSADDSSMTRDRNASISPDQRYDTLIHFNGNRWEMAVPNGTYQVHVVAGDATYTDSVFKIDADGVRVVDGTPTSTKHWIEGTATVTVADGRLTLSNGSGASNNKICFVDVSAVAPGTQLPVVTVSAPTDNASENGPTSRSFTLTRTGDVTKSLPVYFTVGGSATNGNDYALINSPVTFAAGSTTATIAVKPVDDAYVEGQETVTLTLVSESGYAIGAASSATIRISDNDTPVGNTISWTTKAANPIIRAEALRAVVDGKLYVFGGFSGDLGPVKRSDVYDPSTNAWSQLPDLPTRVTHAGVAVDGHDIYVAGGYVGIGSTGYSQQFGTTQVWKYNVDTKQWSSVVSLPKAVAGGGLALIGRSLHWVGGNNSLRQDIGDHYVLNLDNLGAGWKAAVSLPFGRSHMGTVALNGKIYCVGGQFGNDDGLTTQSYVHVWDPAAPDHWTQLASLPTAISHIASATIAYGNRIVVLGGETAHNVPTDLVYAYDPATNKWAAMTKLPAKRFSGVAAEIGGSIYFTTGSSTTTTWKGVVS